MGVTAENTASKAVGDRMLESRRIAIERCANRPRAPIGNRIGIQPYLAIKWQRDRINARCASRGRRFPTPLRTQNAADIEHENGPSVTTRHLFRPTQRRKAALLLPSWLRNLDFLGAECSGG